MGSDDYDTIKPALPLADHAGSAVAHDNVAAQVTHASQSILVLGMHRSGTSAIARVLEAMGAYVGESADLLPAHPLDNPAGYWERTELVIAHDRFLAATGHAWDRVAGLDSRALDTDARATLSSRLQQVIDNLKAAGKPWLVKDPRLCLLLPQWLPLLDDAACVIVVRDPREIAASMRASHRGVYTSHFIMALWEKYLRTMLADLRGRRALFVSYAGMLADAQVQSSRLLQGLRALGIDQRLHNVSGAELETLLDIRLHRSQPRSHMLLSPAQEILFAWLQAQTQAAGPVDIVNFPEHPAPDSVLAEFQNALDDKAERSRAQ